LPGLVTDRFGGFTGVYGGMQYTALFEVFYQRLYCGLNQRPLSLLGLYTVKSCRA
jgi:hypothetical protein